jgi:predicted acylesterase/phospholipase RssA
MKTTLTALALAVALSGCATIERAPFTQREQAQAVIPGIPDARFWADAPDVGARMTPAFAGAEGETSMLALSGGSDNGAYGAGLLNGWSKSGTRPDFAIVTGVSTGALIAPFAFLGPDEDATLERLYTTISARDIYKLRFPLAIPASPSAASTAPLVRLIATSVTDALIDRVAHEQARGRRLFIGTANLDAQRMVIWNMGAIAASRAPGRYALFRQVMLASSAIPALFPPVMIAAQAGGRTISEMHVDGGTTAQILTLPNAAIVAGQAPTLVSRLHLYVIVNNKLNSEFHLVSPKTIPIASQSFSLNLRSSLSGSIDVSYLYAVAHGVDFNLSYIASDYPGDDHKTFDTAYMRKLFADGRRLGATGTFWEKRPPAPGE